MIAQGRRVTQMGDAPNARTRLSPAPAAVPARGPARAGRGPPADACGRPSGDPPRRRQARQEAHELALAPAVRLAEQGLQVRARGLPRDPVRRRVLGEALPAAQGVGGAPPRASRRRGRRARRRAAAPPFVTPLHGPARFWPLGLMGDGRLGASARAEWIRLGNGHQGPGFLLEGERSVVEIRPGVQATLFRNTDSSSGARTSRPGGAGTALRWRQSSRGQGTHTVTRLRVGAGSWRTR